MLIDNFKASIDINLRNEDGRSVIHEACNSNYYKPIAIFINEFKDKIDINAKFTYNSLMQSVLEWSTIYYIYALEFQLYTDDDPYDLFKLIITTFKEKN